MNDEEHEVRVPDRMHNPTNRGVPRALDIASRRDWVDYSRAKDVLVARTDTKIRSWYRQPDNKKETRVNCIVYLLSQVRYGDLRSVEIDLPPRQADGGHKRPKMTSQRCVPDICPVHRV